jgi:signal transduction histidine kinase
MSMDEPGSPRRTAYLPPGRVGEAALAADVSRVTDHPLVESLLDAQRAAVVIVNRQRQIVASNVRFLALAGVRDPAALLGLRFGESFGCTGAGQGPDGCGTAPHCAGCGAALATLAGLRDQGAERECSLRVDRAGHEEDLALRLVSVPFRVSGEPFTALFVSDLTAERRRAAAARAPVAGASRAAGELRAALEAFRRSGEATDLGRAEALADEIRGELAVHALLAGDEVPPASLPAASRLEVRDVLRRLSAALRSHPAAGGRVVEIDSPPPGAAVVGEPAALHHVLLAMAVNAVEATRGGGTVRVAFAETAHEASLRVWNAGAVPAVVRSRLFERFFSTKGSGRGHGTWAMRLLAERVLGARIEWTTSREEGTWFSIVLPRG